MIKIKKLTVGSGLAQTGVVTIALIKAKFHILLKALAKFIVINCFLCPIKPIDWCTIYKISYHLQVSNFTLFNTYRLFNSFFFKNALKKLKIRYEIFLKTYINSTSLQNSVAKKTR